MKPVTYRDAPDAVPATGWPYAIAIIGTWLAVWGALDIIRRTMAWWWL